MEKAEIRKKIMHLFEMQEEIANVAKDYRKTLLDNYRDIIGKFKTVFLFGAGTDGIMAYDFLLDILHDKEVYYIDNNTEKHGKELYKGIYCYGREKMYGCNPESTIILITTTRYAGDILKEFLGEKNSYCHPTQYQDSDKLGMTYINNNFIGILYSYLHGNYYWLNREKILCVFDWLEDDASARLFYQILMGRLNGNRWLRDKMILPQYFPKEIKERFTEEEVFLDCGAFIGDSVEEFRKQTNDIFKAVYSFEMDDKIYNLLAKAPQTYDKRIVCIHAGVSDHDWRITYRKDDCPSYAAGRVLSGDEDKILGEAELRSIDSMVEDLTIRERVTYVKMDIEGAELDALHGMEKLMKRDKPKLAICVYHKPEDIWELPIYIKSVVPEYTMILRQHEWFPNETVLYAYIK